MDGVGALMGGKESKPFSQLAPELLCIVRDPHAEGDKRGACVIALVKAIKAFRTLFAVGKVHNRPDAGFSHGIIRIVAAGMLWIDGRCTSVENALSDAAAGDFPEVCELLVAEIGIVRALIRLGQLAGDLHIAFFHKADPEFNRTLYALFVGPYDRVVFQGRLVRDG